MNKKVLLMLGSFMLLGLTGCCLGPAFCTPKVEFDKDWHALEEEVLSRSDPKALGKLFDDSLLSGYLDSLIYVNHDLKLSHTKVQEAYALRGISSAKLFPSFFGKVDDHRAFPAGGTLQSAQSSVGVGIPLYLKQQNFLANFDAIWELDFFGRNRKEVEGADAFICMEKASYCASLVSLQGECARIYLELRRAQNNLLLIQKELAILKKKEQTAEDRFRLGLDPELPSIEIKASISQLGVQEHLFEGEALRYMYSLSFLLGHPPTFFVEELKNNIAIPKISRVVPIGFPADLLRRRPDIVLAEHRIAKATADVGVAVAELFPKITLDGTFGYQNLHLGRAKGSGSSWSYGGNLLAPIFQGGGLRANLKKEKLVRKEGFISYQQSVLRALEESQSAIVKFIKAKESLRGQNLAHQERLKSFRHTQELYNRGLVNISLQFDEELKIIQSERDLVNQEVSLGMNLIVLYKAIGGGF